MSRVLIVTFVFVCLSTIVNAENLKAEDRPNILFAIADDWGWPHAGAYGDPVVKTPTFDRLAKEGVLFHHAYASSPSCTPSRAALVTGQWHWRLQESANLWSTLRAEHPVYPDLLEEAGYFVGHTRKGWGPGKVAVGGRTRNPAGPKFKDFETFLQERPDGQPFCFWFGSYDPHRGYKKGSGVESGMNLDDIEVPACFPDVPEVRSDVADYYWEVQRFDREVGELLALLAERGELDNTIVVMTGDHGMPFPRCKSNLYDTGSRVPLAVRWPEQSQGGVEREQFVSLTDLAPTFLEAAGVPAPEVMTGRSIRDLLGENPSTDRDHVLLGKERHVPCQEGHPGGTPMRAIRTQRYLYIRNFEPDRWPAGTPNSEKTQKGSWYGDCDNGPTKLFMIRNREHPQYGRLYDLAFGKRPADELYDLEKDPHQLNNVAGDPAHADAQKRLSSRLLQALLDTEDPRVLGKGDALEKFPYYGGGGGKKPKGFDDQ